jgi:hypothetical protein
MNRLQKRYEIMDEDLNILDVCLLVKMSIDGTSDPLSVMKEMKYVNYLKKVIDTWEIEAGNVFQQNFDFSVRNLVLSTLELFENSDR